MSTGDGGVENIDADNLEGDNNIEGDNMAESDPEELPPREVQFMDSQRGGKLMIVDNYIYVCKRAPTSRKDAKKSTYWSCFNRGKCPATAILRPDGRVAVSDDHNHPSHEKAIRIR